MSLTGDPQMVNDDVWFYEDEDGVNVYISRENRTSSATIPWSMVRRSLARKDKRKLPRQTSADSVQRPRKRRAA